MATIKTVARLLLLAHDGADLAMDAWIVASKPISEHQAQKDDEKLRCNCGNEREHPFAKVTGDLLAVHLNDVCERSENGIDIKRPRPLREGAEALQGRSDKGTELA